MSPRNFASLLLLAAPALLGACTGGPTVTGASTIAPDGGASDTTPTEPGDATDPGSDAPTTPKEQCEALIACVADIDPSSAGALVTLYGDASNCWQGGESDAEACGKACAKNLEDRPECTAAPIDRRYLALCDSGMSGEPLRYDVLIELDPRKGGEATFRPLPMTAQKYRSADALMTQPKLALEVASGGAAGETTTPFDVPGAAFDPYGGAPPFTVTKFAVSRLRVEGKNLCSELEGEIAEPYFGSLRGACVYLPLAEGATIPALSSSAIATCAP